MNTTKSAKETAGAHTAGNDLSARINGENLTAFEIADHDEFHDYNTSSLRCMIHSRPDADLIAAAPMLLALSEHVKALASDANFGEACAYLPELEAVIEEARSAISKARGDA